MKIDCDQAIDRGKARHRDADDSRLTDHSTLGLPTQAGGRRGDENS